MGSNGLGRLSAAAIALAVVTSACATLDKPETGWTADEQSIAERRAADEQAESRHELTATIKGLGALESDVADCVVATLVEDRGEAAVAAILDREIDASRFARPIASAVRDCGAGDDLAHRWIPEVTVVLGREGAALQCVDDDAADWAADRFAEILALGGLDPDESVVDEAWLGRVVDRCDAGAAMMAADATLRPRVGADARTPRRWLCAAARAPAGTFDALFDPAVTGDESRLETVESLIAQWFEGCD